MSALRPVLVPLLGVVTLVLCAATALFPPHSASGSFPGTNGEIAYVTGGNVAVMRPDGSARIRITSSPGYDSWPAWSPDGSKIAFERTPGGSNAIDNSEIYVMNADGSGLTQLTNNSVFDGHPSWSPDGTKIAFTSARDYGSCTDIWLCNLEIYVMDADGSNPTRLTISPFTDQLPVFSPDGTKIAFTTNRDALPGYPNSYEAYTMNADGSNQTSVSNDALNDYLVTDWSPDGAKLLFVKIEYLYGVNGRGASSVDIWSMLADGSGKTDLTNTNGGGLSDVELTPAWSPDGSKIVYVRFNAGNLVMNADGSSQAVIVPAAESGFDLNWGTQQVSPPDADADGVADAVDACPGSDDNADLDGDGIPDGCDPDQDGDGCPDVNELQTAAGSEFSGGRRDPRNPWDYFDPEKINTPHKQTLSDIQYVVNQYGKNQGDPAYTTATDRTFIGPNNWNLGPPDGKQTVTDILAAIDQYQHNCP